MQKVFLRGEEINSLFELGLTGWRQILAEFKTGIFSYLKDIPHHIQYVSVMLKLNSCIDSKTCHVSYKQLTQTISVLIQIHFKLQ